MNLYMHLLLVLPVLSLTTAHALEIPQIDMSNEEYEKYSQYCLDHTKDILLGFDPLDDLRKAGLSYLPEGITCQNLDLSTLQSRNLDSILNGDSPLKDLLNSK